MATDIKKRTKIILSIRAKNLLLPNKRIKDKIAEALGISTWTIHRWIQQDDPQITQAQPMKIIRDQTGLADEFILQEVEA